MSLTGLFESASGWVLMFLGLGFLVFVHELGHFLMAKRAGVNVEVFSVGMGPFLLTTARRGTVYALSLIPFGGYVRMTGQADLVVERKGPMRPDSYLAKGPGTRATILAAGAVMNVLAAYLLFMSALVAGARFVPAEVGRFDPKDPDHAELTSQGIEPGDRILAVDGTPVERFQWDLMQIVAARGSEEGPVALRMERPSGETYEAELHARRNPALPFAILAIPIPSEEIMVRFGVEGSWGVLVRTEPGAPAGSPLQDLRFITGLALEEAEGAGPGPEISLDQKGRSPGEILSEALRRAGEAGTPLHLTFFDGTRASVRPCRVDRYRIGIGLEGLRVHFVQRGTPAERASLRPGERVTAVDGERVANVRELIGRLNATEGKPFELTLEGPPGQDGPAPAARTVTISAARDSDWALGVPEDGFALGAKLDRDLVVQKVAAGHAAARAGLEPGDRVLSIDGARLRSRGELLRRVRESGGRVLALGIGDAKGQRSTILLRAQSWRPVRCAGAVRVRRVERGSPGARAGLREGDLLRTLVLRGRGRSARIAWLRRAGAGEEGPLVSRSARVRLVETGPALRFEIEKRTTIKANPFTKAGRDLWLSIRTVGRILGGLFRGRVSTKALSGPLGIGMITVASTELGFGNFLWILAMISANLGIINLLPIPILDGGHLVFLGYEKLRGRPASPRVQELALYLGLAFILALVALAMRNDISMFILGP